MKKLAVLFIALLTTMQVAFAGFIDLNSKHSYFDAIEFLQNRDIVEGYPDGSFQADRPLERYELLKIVVESAYTDSEIATALDEYKALNYYYVDLKDVPMGKWFSPYVRIGVRDHIVFGYSSGLFEGKKQVNFVEALQMVMKTYALDYDEDATLWYEDMVNVASAANIIPLDITSFGQKITRGQMAELITRTIKYNEGTLDDYLGDASVIHQTFDDIEAGNNQLEKLDELIEEKNAKQCSDGLNNDGDAFVDEDDPGCWTDPLDKNTYDPKDDAEGDEPLCADKIDNDKDGLTDKDDPACWTNVADATSYDPEKNTESGEPACIDNVDNDKDGLKDDKDPGCHTDNDPNNSNSYDPTDNDETHVYVDPEPLYNDKNQDNAERIVDALEAFKVDVGLYPGLPDKAECLVNDQGAGLDLKAYIDGGVIPNTPKPNQDLKVGDTFCLQTYFYIPLKFQNEIRKGYVLIIPMTDPNRANFLLSDVGLMQQNPTIESITEFLDQYDTSKIIDADVNDRVLVLTNQS